MNIVFSISIALIIIGGLTITIIEVSKLGKEKVLEMVAEWLLLAVIQAEKELGSGTGQVKLRFVYDMFISKFKKLALFISFEQFSLLVDEALDKMKHMLESNDKLLDYVNGENN